MPVSPERPSTTSDDGHSGSAGVGGATGNTEATSDVSSRAQDQAIEAPEYIEDADEQRGLRAPATPTREEIADHMANGHLPYRSWCPDCVEAFGREWLHEHGEARSISPISCDYLFIHPGIAEARGAYGGRAGTRSEGARGVLQRHGEHLCSHRPQQRD